MTQPRVSRVRWRRLAMPATVVGIALALAGGCGDDRSRAESDLREPTRPEKGAVDGGAPGSGEWRKSQVVGCESAAVYLVPLGNAVEEAVPVSPERAKEYARVDHPLASHAETLITFFEESDTRGAVASVRLALRCGTRWLLVDRNGNAEWDGVKGRFDVMGCMRFLQELQLPVAQPTDPHQNPLTLAHPVQYIVSNRTPLMVELHDSSGRPVLTIPPMEAREVTTWWTRHSLAVREHQVLHVGGSGEPFGFIRHYIGSEYEVLDSVTNDQVRDLVVQGRTAPPLPERESTRWYEDYGGRTFVFDPSTEEIAEVEGDQVVYVFVKHLEEVKRLVRKGWWREIEPPPSKRGEG